MKTNTLYVDLKKLYNAGHSEASLIIRLMLACNDISLANKCMSYYKNAELKMTEKHVKLGAALYFIRLQCGHLHEVMHLINELNNSLNSVSLLANIFEKCSELTKNDFYKLRDCLENHPNRSEFLNKVEMLRHKTVFHYKDKKLFKDAILRRSTNKKSQYSSITRSKDISCIRFNVADEIIDTIVCRFLWKLEGEENILEQADQAAGFGSDLCKAFVNFCLEYIFRYIKEYGNRE